MSAATLILLVAVLIVGVLIFVAILLSQKRRTTFDVEAYQTAFLKIDNSLRRDQPTSYTAVVVEADKLLDKALIELGLPGKTMGDRLKKSAGQFSQLNSVWHAHKLRNQIAHEAGFTLSYAQARHALLTYRRALQDLGAI